MQVVQVRGEAQPLNGALDVFLDVRGGIGDAAAAEDIEAAFGGDWCVWNVRLNECCVVLCGDPGV